MSFNNIAQQMRDEAEHILDRGIITRGQRLVVAGLLRDAADEFDRLTDWRNQALASLDGVEHLWHEAGCPGPLGFSKIAAVAGVLERLQVENRQLQRENRAWMNGVADVVEPLGYDREAACGPSDLLPGLQDLTDQFPAIEQARRLSECVEARSYLYEQVVALSAQLDEMKRIAEPDPQPQRPTGKSPASSTMRMRHRVIPQQGSKLCVCGEWFDADVHQFPDPPDPRDLPPFDPETLDEVRRFYETGGRGME
jgi:hypothetical protein